MRLGWEGKKPPPRLSHLVPFLSDKSYSSPGLPSPPPSPINELSRPALLKRLRSEEDVDGENSKDVQRKKRRLRLDLVTSRLSRPYATPPTHILTRKVVKTGFHNRPNLFRKDFFRKAALLNSYKRRQLRTGGGAKGPVVSSMLETIYETPDTTDVDAVNGGKAAPTPHAGDPRPSPLSKDYYDALDDEDEEGNIGEIGKAEEEDDDSDEDSICTYGDYFEGPSSCFGSEENPIIPNSHLLDRPEDSGSRVNDFEHTLDKGSLACLPSISHL